MNVYYGKLSRASAIKLLMLNPKISTTGWASKVRRAPSALVKVIGVALSLDM